MNGVKVYCLLYFILNLNIKTDIFDFIADDFITAVWQAGWPLLL